MKIVRFDHDNVQFAIEYKTRKKRGIHDELYVDI